MKLYFSPGACSLSPHIVLREAGAKFDLERVDGATKKTASGADFRAINPKAYVPALELDDGQLLTEGAVIVQYVADKHPDAQLAPKHGTMERYRLQEWLNYLASEVHKGFTPLFNKGATDEMKAASKERLLPRLAHADAALAKQPFLMGERFSVADAYLFTVANWANFVKVDLEPFAALRQFQARVAARPAVQESMKAEGLLK